VSVSDTRLLVAQADALVARVGPLAGITADSREARPQVAFAAYPGHRRDGRAFIGDAIARGATAILFEARGFDWNGGWRVPHVAVADLQSRVGFIASAVYGRPSQALWVVGVTGTNGKTSCSHWTAQALARCGRRAAVMGTLGHGFIDALSPSTNTTPDACVIQQLLAQWVHDGANAVAMEVSSHGLDQGRVNGIAFDVALFTNLTRDHLDYHGSMAAYGEAKARLLRWPGLRAAVINTGDAFGRELVRNARSHRQKVITYGSQGADIVATKVDTTTSGMSIAIATPPGRMTAASLSRRSAGEATKQATQRHQLASMPPAGRGSVMRSSSWYSTFAWPRPASILRPASTKRLERSTATTRPPGPTISARSAAANPGPAPTSSTLEPGPMPARRQHSSTVGFQTRCWMPSRSSSSSCVPRK